MANLQGLLNTGRGSRAWKTDSLKKYQHSFQFPLVTEETSSEVMHTDSDWQYLSSSLGPSGSNIQTMSCHIMGTVQNAFYFRYLPCSFILLRMLLAAFAKEAKMFLNAHKGWEEGIQADVEESDLSPKSEITHLCSNTKSPVLTAVYCVESTARELISD